jgi:hypothetical protein
MLRTLVREACRQDLGEHDLVVGGSASPDELAIFFQRSRSGDKFYRERLPAKATSSAAPPPSSAPARPLPDGASAETPFDLGYAAAQATLRRLTKMCRRTPTEGTRERRARVDRNGSQRAAPRTNSTQRRRANATRTQKEPPRNNSTQRRRANATRTQ